MHLQRVDPDKLCHCGSGKAFKDCCHSKTLQWIFNTSSDDYFREPNILSTVLGDYKLRFIFNKIYYSPKEEHLNEFLYNIVLWTLGKKWHTEQIAKKPKEQHVVMRWIYSRYYFLKELERLGCTPKNKVRGTGDVIAFMTLASDLYYLQIVNELPKELVEKLRTYDAFQGARYEIGVAASLVRAGFEIKWKKVPKGQKHYEFDATHKHTKESIAVEAKSKTRKGILNKPGSPEENEGFKIFDMLRLYNEAMQQNPGDKPFVVFIDINTPAQIEVAMPERKWVQELAIKVMEAQETFFGNVQPNLLVITNFSWHYDGDTVAGEGEYAIVVPPTPSYPLNPITLEAVKRAVGKFSYTPDERNS